MPDRTLVAEWPEYVNSTGVPGTGTKVTEELLDGIKAAVEAAVYDPSLEEDPPAIAREVTGARGPYSSLDARLDAIELIASGGDSVAAVPGQVNLVPNGNFLIWSGGSTAAPTFFTPGGTPPTIERQSARGLGTDAVKVPGPYFMNLTSAAPGNKDIYIDLISAADLASNGSYPLSQRKFAAGIFYKSSTPGSISLIIDDGTTETAVQQADSSGAWAYMSVVATLATAPTRLRLIIRISAVATVSVAGLCAYAADNADRYVPPPTIEGDIIYAEPGGTVATGDKAIWYPARPCFVHKAYGLCASGTGTIVVKKGTSTSMFPGDVQVSSNPTEEVASDASVASLGTGDKLTISVSASTSMVTPTLRLRYVAFANPFAGYFTEVPV